ncbi:hypothetical protein X943_001814 [Babesia divergens]|uniref:Uncharacterized protein n=1 Tax=Babesia divergens TaxID=32595 RepID=A0AAD9GK29_BABDI|nr:hypothetical protein X943_001814 [Babesia divergens]
MSEKGTCNFEFKHETLKEILEELYKLHGMDQTKPKVFQQLKSYLKAYCGVSYLNDFYGSRDYGVSSYGGSILLLTYAGEKVSEAILKSTPWASQIQDTHKDHTGQTCGGKYFNALKKCLPKTFAALFFLFFNVSNECKGFGGGSWNSLPVNGSGQNLKNWLIGGSGSDLPGGFSGGDLNTSKTGKNVADALKKAVSLKPDTNEGPLQKALSHLLFSCPWDDALAGHACLFLDKFCDKVLEGSESFLKGPYKEHSGAFKDVCSALKSDLQPFIDGSSGLSAVCHGNTNLFEDLWDDRKFSDYCEWLKRNIYRIIASLVSMSGESPGWNLSTIQNAYSAGPFLYGFVPKDKSWMTHINSKLPKAITPLTASLEKLEKALQTSSTAATAGGVTTGVLGAGGLGFGAAYATNAFGFQNFITGLLSSFLK